MDKNLRIQLTLDSVITLVTLQIQDDGETYFYVGNRNTGKYVQILKKYYSLLPLFDGKRSILDVVSILNKDVTVHQITVPEVISLIFNFLSFGFVATLDDRVLVAKSTSNKDTLLLWPWLWSWWFGYPALIIKSVLFLFAFGIIFGSAFYWPHVRDNFWHSSLSISLLTGFIYAWLLVWLHELQHYLTARMMGIPATMRMSRRLFFLVAETQVDHIYSLPRLKRYLIYINGVALHAFLFGIGVIWLWFMRDVHGIWYIGLVKQFVTITLFGLLWEFQVFMRTDFYALLADCSGLPNLLTRTLQKWRERLNFNFVKKKNSANFSIKQKNIVQVYSIYIVIGFMFAIWRLGWYTIPFVWFVFTIGFLGLQQSSDIWSVADNLIPMLLLGGHYGLLGFLWVKDWKKENNHF